jgi:gliding motility-associated-like protein
MLLFKIKEHCKGARCCMAWLIVLFITTAIEVEGQSFSVVPGHGIPALANAKARWADFNNDGLLDLFISGTNNGGGLVTSVYISNGNNTFNVIGLTAVADAGFDIGDYNNDGFLDIVISGITSSAVKKTIVYRNTSGTGFAAASFGLENLSKGGVLWRDLDNDTDLDLVLTGFNASNQEKTFLYRFSSNQYQVVSHSMPNLSNGQIKVLDANNDDLPEILLTGLNSNGVPVSAVYTIDSNLHPALYTTLRGFAFDAIETIDFNSDGFEDLLIAGLADEDLTKKTVVLQNSGAGGFIEVSTILENVSGASLGAGDLNNDGKSDIILSGIDDAGLKYFKYYGNASPFTSVAHALPNIYNGDACVGDYDNDTDLDIFQIGNSDISFQSNLYKSDQASTQGNAAPAVPSNLQVVVTIDSVYLSWDAVTDDHTNANSISYNVYISSDQNGVNPVVSPGADVTSGFRKITLQGNAGHKTFKSFHSLPEGRYYWSVQAIDNGFNASDFAAEQSFAICYPFSLGDDAIICEGDEIQLSAGDSNDEVNWYTKTSGLLLADHNDLTHTILSNDTLIAELTRPYNCTVKDTLIIEMSTPPVFSLGNNTAICSGQEFSLSITQQVDSVNWLNPDGELKRNSTSYSYQVAVKDTIIAHAYNVHKCMSADSIVVDVLSLPLFSSGNDRSICYGQHTLLEVTGSWQSVDWSSLQQGMLASNASTYSFRVLEKDTVVAKVKDANGCVNYDSAIVQVLDLPVITLGEDRSICYEEQVQLQLTGSGNSIKWLDTDQNILASNVTSFGYQVLNRDTTIVEVTDANNCVSFDSVIVSVLPLPQFDVGEDTAICFGQNILLQTGAGFQRVDWYSKSLDLNIHADSWFFNYEVQVTDTLIAKVLHPNGCTNYDSIRIEMLPLPVYSLGVDRDICYGDEVTFNIPGSWAEVNWYTEGDLVLQANNSSFTYNIEQNMPLWAEVFDTHGCVSYDTVQITMRVLPEFDLGADKQFCKNDDISLKVVDGAASYAWRDENGLLLSDISSYNFKATTSEKIFLRVRDRFECNFVDSVFVQVNPLPVFSVIGDFEICENDTTHIAVDFRNPVAVKWETLTNEMLSSADQLVMSFSATTPVNVTLTDDKGCTDVKPMTVTVNIRPKPDAGADQLICFGETIALGSEQEPGNTYDWNPALALDNPKSSRPKASPLESVTYTLTITNAKNCTATDSVYVEVNPEIIVDAGPNIAICTGDSIVLGGNPTATGSRFHYSYQWLAGEQPLQDNVSNPTVGPVQTTLYYVLVTSGKCTVEYDSVEVVVNPLPVVSIISDQSIGAGSGVQLYVEGGLEFAWAPAESLDDASIAAPVASPLKTTKYHVKVKDENHCIDTASVKVFVQNNLFIPNLFSPNGDGSNDVFKLYGSGVKEITLSVFDQKGNEVFRTSDKIVAFETGWDGKSAGKFLKDDVYIWTIDGVFFNGDKISFEGNNTGIVKLMR